MVGLGGDGDSIEESNYPKLCNALEHTTKRFLGLHHRAATLVLASHRSLNEITTAFLDDGMR